MSQEEYLREYNKYKDIQLFLGAYKNKEGISFEIIEITEEKIKVRTTKSGIIKDKTPHWCKKYLIRIEN